MVASSFRNGWQVLAAALCVGAFGVATAQDDPPAPKTDPAPATKAPADGPAIVPAETDPVAQWKSLSERRLTIAKRLPEIRKEYDATPVTEKDKRIALRGEYTALIAEFTPNPHRPPGVADPSIEGRLERVAEAAFAKDPTNREAGTFAVKALVGKNKYREALDVGAQVLALPGSSPYRRDSLRESLGQAHFALHEFDEAQKMFVAADDAGEFPKGAGDFYHDLLATYVEAWKKEQALREKEAQAPPGQELPRVLLKTSKGDVEVELFENEAPNTVANFVSLVEGKRYDGVPFHRVIPDFMIQGGRIGGGEEFEYTIPCECFKPEARLHFRGSLSMAHAGRDTGGSQFFVTHKPTSHLNPAADDPKTEYSEARGHTVFGRVVSGQDVVDAIQEKDEITSATVIRKRSHEYKPTIVPRKKADAPADKTK